MVAIVSGNSLGLVLSSLGSLGTRGTFGNASFGRNGETAFVNAATGNLSLQRVDELLHSRGGDVASVRTYNSLGKLNDDNADNWSLGVYGAQIVLSGSANQAGSSIVRTERDGGESTYVFDSGRGLYIGKAGGGSFDTISLDSKLGIFTWTDGDSGAHETYGGISRTAGHLLSSSDSSGNATAYTWNGSLLVAVTDASGDQTFYDYNGSQLAQIRSVTNNGASTSLRVRYAYDGSNRLSTVTVDLSPQDGSVADGATYVTSYTYDGNSTRVASVTQSDGSALSITYVQTGSDFRVATVTDALGQTTSFSYDLPARRTTVTDPLGLISRYDYDALGQLQAVSGAAAGGGAATETYSYDGDGNLSRFVDARGGWIDYAYDAQGNQTLQRDWVGNTITRSFDARNQLLTEVFYTVPDPDGAGVAQPGGALVTRRVYEGGVRHLLRYSISPEGRVSKFVYDAYGQLTATVDYSGAPYPVGALATTDVPSEAQLDAWDAAQDKTRSARQDFVYDARGQLQRSTTYATVDSAGAGLADGSQATTQYLYDAAGLLLQTVSAGSGVNTYTYDGLGRVLTASDPLLHLTVTQYDDANGKVAVTAANGLTTTSSYDRAGRMVSARQSTLAAGILGESRYFYDADGRLRMTQSATGERSFALYDEAGRQVAAVDALGTLTEYAYNAVGLRTETVVYATPISTALLLDNTGQPANATLASLRPAASAADRRAWSFYDNANRLVKSVDGGGDIVETSYDGASRIVRVVAYATQISVAGFGPTPELTAAIPTADPARDRVTRSFYDGDGRLVASLDAEGALTELAYDAAGRLLVTTRYATATNAAYRSAGTLDQLRPSTSGQDLRSVNFYNARGQLAATVDAEGYVSETVYDAAGRVSSTVRYANKTAAAVVAGASVASIRPAVSASDRTQSFVYDSLDRVVQQANAEGTVTAFEYDIAGNLVKTTAAVGSGEVRTTGARFDAQGRLVAELGGEGSAHLTGGLSSSEIDAVWAQYGVAYSYDAAGRRLTATDALGNRSWFYYDLDGRLTQTVNAVGEVSEQQYDGFGELTASVRYAARISTTGLSGGIASPALLATLAAARNAVADARTSASYDARGLLATKSDALGNLVGSTYNAFGELVSTATALTGGATRVDSVDRDRLGRGIASHLDRDGLNATTTTQYDAYGRAIVVTDANGHSVSSSYDRLGRVVQTVDAVNSIRRTTYDAFDRVLTSTDALNRTTSYAYDAAARSVSVTSPEGVVVRTARTRHGQTLSVTDGNNQTTTYAYDRDGHLTSTSAPLATTASSYDRAGQLFETTSPTGTVVRYAYDTVGRVLSQRVDPNGLDLTTRYAYDGLGRAVSVTDANGTVTTTSFDAKGEAVLRTVDPGGLNLQTRASFDSEGRALTVTDAVGTVTRYTYDSAGRRISEQVDPSGLNLTTLYAYDAAGNVVASTDATGAVTRYAYDSAYRLLFKVDGAGDVTRYDYDAEGRVVRSTGYAAAISLAGLATAASATQIAARVVGTPGQDQVESKRYDGDGRLRFSVDGNGAVSEFGYDGNGNVVATRRYANTIDLASWNIAADPPVVADAGRDERTRTVYDAANRATFVADAAGDVVQSVYDAAGRVAERIEYATAVAEGADPSSVGVSANDRVSRYAYDAAGRQVLSADALGGVTELSYDGAGHVTSRKEYAKAATLPAGILGAAQIRGGVQLDAVNDRITRYAYDAAGRQVLAADAMGSVTGTAYDGEGRVVVSVAYANSIADTAPLSAVVASAGDHVGRYAYDAAGRQVLSVDALGAVTELTYDGIGHVTSKKEYAKPIALPSTGSIDGKTVTVGGDNGFVIGSNEIAIDPSRTYRVHARVRQLSGTGTVYVGVDTRDAATSQLYNPYGGTFSYAGGIQTITPEMGWVDFNGTITGEYTPGPGVYDYNKFFTGSRYATPLILFNYYGTNSDPGRIVEIDSLEFFDVGTGAELSASAGMEAGTGSLRVLAGAVDSAYSSTATALSAVQIRSELHPDGINDRLSQYSYDAAGRLVQEAHAARTDAEATTLYRYDGLGRLTAQVEARGFELTYFNRPWAVSERTRLGFAADASALDATQRRAMLDRYTTTYAYDAAGRRVSTIAPTSTTSTTYDTFGNAVRVVDPLGNAGVFYFDKLGRVTLQVDPEGYATETTYAGTLSDKVQSVRRYANRVGSPSPAARPALVGSSLDAVTSYTYDRLGRVLTTTDATGASEGIAYGAAGNRFAKAVTNKLGGTAVYAYDRDGREINETLPVTAKNGSGVATAVVNSYAYDAFGNRIRSVEAVGLPEQRTTSFVYDADGRVLYRIGQPVVAFDAATQTSNVVTPAEATRYDAFGDAIETIGHATWDGSAVQGGSRSLSYYDTAGNVVASIAADGAYTAYFRDTAGHVAVETDYANRVALPTSAGGSAPTPVVDSVNDRTTRAYYDAAGRQTLSRRDNVTHWEQSSLGDAITLNLPGAPDAVTLSQQIYDAAGNVVQQIDGRGNSIFNYYDKIGRKVFSIDQDGYATAWDYADLFDTATQETHYSTRLANYARQDDTGAPAAWRDPAAMRAGLADGSLRPTDGNSVARLNFNDGTNSSISQYLGSFGAGDTVTVTVWFKCDPQTQAMTFVGDAGGPDPYDNCKYSQIYGDGGWRQMTTTLTFSHADQGWIYLYGDRSGAYAKAGNFVEYDRLEVRSAQRGLILADGFESGFAGWSDGGAAPALDAASAVPDRVVTQVLDRAGRVVEHRVKNVAFDYVDGNGALTRRMTDAVTQTSYDGLGNVIQQRERVAELADNVTNVWNVTDIAYDKLGRETNRQQPGFVDSSGASVRPTTSLEYDGLGHVSRSLERGTDNNSEADDRVTQIRYNVNGDRVQVIDAAGNVTRFDLDAQGRVARSTSVGVRDADGNLRDIATLYQYDAAGRAIVQTDVGSGEVRKTAYDAFGEISAKGLGDGWQEFIQYNTLGKVQKSNTGDGVTKIYLYDANGNATRQISSGSTDLTSISVAIAAQDASLLHTFSSYDKRNELVRTVEPDISFLRDKVSMQGAFLQQLADLYGAISVGNSGGGSYTQGSVDTGGYTLTQVSGSGSGDLMITPPNASASGGPSLSGLGATAPGLSGIGSMSFAITWGGDLDGMYFGQNYPPSTLPFYLPATLPDYTYRVISSTGTLLASNLRRGSSVSIPSSYSAYQSLQMQIPGSGNWVEVSQLRQQFARGGGEWTRVYSSTETRLIFLPNMPSGTIEAVRDDGSASASFVSGITALRDVTGAAVAGWYTLDTSSLSPGSYSITVRGYDNSWNLIKSERLAIAILQHDDDPADANITAAAVTNPDVRSEPRSSPFYDRIVRFNASVIGASAGTFYVRAKGSTGNYAAYGFNTSYLNLASYGLPRGTNYEFYVAAGGRETYGEFFLDGNEVATFANNGMLRTVTRAPRTLSFDTTGRLSSTSASTYRIYLTIGGVSINKVYDGHVATFDIASELGALGISNYADRNLNYGFAVYGGQNGLNQFVGSGTGTVQLGPDFATVNYGTPNYQPIGKLILPAGFALSGALTLTPRDNPGDVNVIANGDWRRIGLNSTTLGLDLSQWMAAGPRTIDFSYSAGDARFTGSFQLNPAGNVDFLGMSCVRRQPMIPLTIAGATSLSVLRVGATNGTLAPVSLGSVSTSGSTFTWNAADQAGLGQRRFYYEAVNGAGQLVGAGYGTFTLAADGTLTYAADAPVLLPSFVRFAPPANAASFELRVRANASAAWTVYSSLPVDGAQRVFDATSLRPASGSSTWEYAYSARDAGNNLVSSGSGTLTVNANGATSSSNVEDRKPTIVALQGPPGLNVPYLQLDRRAVGSTGAYASVVIAGTWDGSKTTFTWDASALTPLTGSVQYEFVMRLQNGDRTAFRNEVGDAIEINGVMTLGGTSSNAVQLQQYVTRLAQQAQVKHMQTFDAFGEIVEEYDDRVFQRMQAMVAQYGGTANASAARTSFTYNALGKLITKTDAETNIVLANGYRYRDRPVTHYGYDLSGRTTTITDANGNLSKQSFAGEGERLAAQWAGDGGRKSTEYDVFGAARKLTDELGHVTTQDFDALNHLVRVQHLGIGRVENFTDTTAVASTLTDSYEVDVLGRRVKHTNSVGTVDKTYYDGLGRVTASVSGEGRRTNYTYAFIAAGTIGGILGAGGKNVGGYQLTTINPDGRSTTDRTDYFGRTTWHQDLGGRTYSYSYDIGGRLAAQTSSAGQNLQYAYYANGYVAEAKDLSERTLSRYGYDNAGNRTWELYSGLDAAGTGPVGVYQASDIGYDELNRISRVKDLSVDVQYDYDAVGNRRDVRATYWDPLTLGTRRSEEFWYTYDAANRFTMTKGSFTGMRGTSAGDNRGGIVLGAAGVQIGYDLAGERISARNADGSVETYSYSADGYLEDTRIDGTLRARRRVDSAGRTLQYKEWEANGAVRQTKTSLYDRDNRLLRDTVAGTPSGDGTTNYYYYNDAGDTQGSALQYGSGALARADFTSSSSSSANFSTTYGYVYWDGAKQSWIKKQGSSQSVASWAPGMSSFSYDANGYLKRAYDYSGGRSLNYYNNATGLVLKRDETVGVNTYSHYWYYAAGQRVGDVTTDPNDTFRQSYAESLAVSLKDLPTDKDRFKNFKPATSADFDQNYEPINPSYPAATGGSYTVRTGDTLKTIAQSLWGDSAMWYLIAEANDLSGRETLTAGQVLAIPNKVTNIHNNAQTFRPYNPGEVIGHVDPTLPSPVQKGHSSGCGGLGMIIMIVVAVVVTIWTAGAASALFAGEAVGGFGATMTAGAGVLTGAGGLSAAGVASAAIGGAAGSIASQGVGMAIGNVDKFSWTAVAASAIGAGAGAGIGQGINALTAEYPSLGAAGSLLEKGSYTRAAISGSAASAVSQAMQGKWDWREIAASAVGSAAGAAAGDAAGYALKDVFGASGALPIASRLASGVVGGWASEQVKSTDSNYTAARLSTIFVGALGSAIGDEYTQAVIENERVDRLDEESRARAAWRYDSLDSSNQDGAWDADEPGMATPIRVNGRTFSESIDRSSRTFDVWPSRPIDLSNVDATQGRNASTSQFKFPDPSSIIYGDKDEWIPVWKNAEQQEMYSSGAIMPLGSFRAVVGPAAYPYPLTLPANAQTSAFVDAANQLYFRVTAEGVDRMVAYVPGAPPLAPPMPQQQLEPVSVTGARQSFVSAYRDEIGDLASGAVGSIADFGGDLANRWGYGLGLSAPKSDRSGFFQSVERNGFVGTLVIGGVNGILSPYAVLGAAGTGVYDVGAGLMTGNSAQAGRGAARLTYMAGLGAAAVILPRAVNALPGLVRTGAGYAWDLGNSLRSTVRSGLYSFAESVATRLESSSFRFGAGSVAGDFALSANVIPSTTSLAALPPGRSLILAPIEIRFPMPGYNEQQQLLASLHLAEQQAGLNHLSLLHPDELRLNLANYQNISNLIAGSRRTFRSYSPSAVGDAAHRVDSVAGGRIHDFAGFRDPATQQRIGSLWRTRSSQIVPGREHRLVADFDD